MPKPVIALDADGVLLDLSLGYASVWERAFGVRPAERDPKAYWPYDRWAVERLDDEIRRTRFRDHFDEAFWEAVPVIEGAVEACHRLHDAGHDLVCVSALDAPWQAARLRNLRAHGFPIERVIATGNVGADVSPKAAAIAELAPEAFVDDYLPYFRGLPERVHTALILRGPNGSPNVGEELRLARSSHDDLAAFAAHWLAR